MRIARQRVGAVFPPNKPRKVYDPEASTSWIAVFAGIVLAVLLIAAAV
jgi:hypothetical protein